MEHCPVIKNEILPSARTWVDVEGIILSEVSQTEKDTLCGITYPWNLKHSRPVNVTPTKRKTCRCREPVTLHTKQGHIENRIARYPPLRMHYLQGRCGILVTHSLGSFQIQTHWSLVSALSWAKAPSSPPASNRLWLLPLLSPGGWHFIGQSCSPSAVGREPYQLQLRAPACALLFLYASAPSCWPL